MRYYNELPERYYLNKKNIKNLGEIFKDINLYKRKKKEVLINDEILNIWDKYIDDEIKQHGKISFVKNGILYLEIDSNTWLHHISNFYKQDILNYFQRNSKRIFISDIKLKLIS